MTRASEAYDLLHTAMTTTLAPCAGIGLFTADDLSAADKAVLTPICDTCPLFDLCRDYADAARPTAGLWAGKTYGTRPATKKDN
jgi:hypothetical protein